jgi:hypothetical protein
MQAHVEDSERPAGAKNPDTPVTRTSRVFTRRGFCRDSSSFGLRMTPEVSHNLLFSTLVLTLQLTYNTFLTAESILHFQGKPCH